MYASMKISELNSKATFITASDLQNTPSLIDNMLRNGHTPIVVPDNLISKIEDYNIGATEGKTLITANQYIIEEQKNFIPQIIDINSLSSNERNIYNKTEKILELIGGRASNIKAIQIVDKIYENEFFDETVGLWIPDEGRILIKRTQLQSLYKYAGTLLHECCHAISGFGDVSRDFERELTTVIGVLASKAL